MENLERFIRSDKTKLSNKAYFQSALIEGKRVGLLNDNDIEQIQLDCLELLSQKIEKEISDYSSSVSEHVAQNLLASILYTIGLALKEESDSDSAIISLREKSIVSLYQKGRLKIDIILNEIKKQYCKIKDLRCSFHNTFYDFAINKQFTLFLTKYNPDLSAHDAEFIPEYPVECPRNDLIGVEYVKAYADALYIENWFCRQFSKEEFSNLLTRFEELTADIQCNIYHYTLRLAIANLLINKNFYRLQFTENDFEDLKNILDHHSKTEIEKLLLQSFKEYIKENNIEPIYARYICRSLYMISTEIYTHAKNNSLKKIYIPKKQENPRLQLYINEDISNSKYCNILREISQEDIKKQIQLITKYATSPTVLIELISDLFYTPQDIVNVLNALDDLSLSILFKFCETEQDINFYSDNKHKNFYNALEKALSAMDVSRRNKIQKLAENIDFFYS